MTGNEHKPEIPLRRRPLVERGLHVVLRDTLDRSQLPQFNVRPAAAGRNPACTCGQADKQAEAGED